MLLALGNCSALAVFNIKAAKAPVHNNVNKALLNITIFNTFLMIAVVIHSIYTSFQIVCGSNQVLLIIRHHIWPPLWLIVPPILISLRFALYSFFTMLIMMPLRNPSQNGHRYINGFSKNHRNIAIIFVGVMSLVTFLSLFEQFLKVVSVLIGSISIVIAIAYSSIAYRCFVLLTTVSRGTSGRIQEGIVSYDHIARFTLSVSAMYGIGHVCQSFVYLSSVFWPHLYARNFSLFQASFKWSDMFTLMASMLYVYRSVRVVRRRHADNLRSMIPRPPQLMLPPTPAAGPSHLFNAAPDMFMQDVPHMASRPVY